MLSHFEALIRFNVMFYHLVVELRVHFFIKHSHQISRVCRKSYVRSDQLSSNLVCFSNASRHEANVDGRLRRLELACIFLRRGRSLEQPWFRASWTTRRRLKTRDLTSRDWTTRDHIARVDIARLISVFEWAVFQFLIVFFVICASYCVFFDETKWRNSTKVAMIRLNV